MSSMLLGTCSRRYRSNFQLQVIPTDYYNNMTGVLSDDALLNILLAIRLPKILDKLDELGV